MHPRVETIFDEAENRYLNPEELGVLSQYVDSLPARLELYRAMRDNEIAIMQAVADQLQAEFPNEKIESLERSIKNALLVLRYSAMGMLLNDETFITKQLLNWLQKTVQAYNTLAVDTALYRLLDQQLQQQFGPQQLVFLHPMLDAAKQALLGQEDLSASALGW